MFFAWLRTLSSCARASKRRPANAGLCRPWLEALEERLAPAATLSFPRSGVFGSPNSVIDFPVNISALTDGTHVGLNFANLAVNFPTGEFDLTKLTVSLGDIPLSDTAGPGGAADWTLSMTTPVDGLLTIRLSSLSGDAITTNTYPGGGTLVHIGFPVLAVAPGGNQTINVAVNVGFRTMILGADGPIALSTVSSNILATGTIFVNQELLPPVVPSTPVMFQTSAGVTLSQPGFSLPPYTGILTGTTDPNLPGLPDTLATINGNPLSSGSPIRLPSGATLTADSNGSFVYVPAPGFAGTDSFTFQAQNAVTVNNGLSSTGTVQIVVFAPLAITTASLPGGEVSTAYIQTLSAMGGRGPYTFLVTAGSLPPGLTLNSATGILSGTPTSVGSSTFTVTATDSLGTSTGQVFTLTVQPGPLSQFLVTLQGSSTVAAGVGFVVSLQAADAFGNAITSNYSGLSAVPINVTPTYVANTIPGMVAINSSGRGFFLGSLQQAGAYTIAVAVLGGSVTVTATHGPAVKLAFGVQPVSAPTGATLLPLTVQVEDPYGNLVTSDNGDVVTLGIASGPGTFRAGSVTSATVKNGVATFNNLGLTVPGTYSLSEIVAGTYTGPDSTFFDVQPLQVLPGSFVSSVTGFSLRFNAAYLVNSLTPVLYGVGFGPLAPIPSGTLTQVRDASGNVVVHPVEGSLILNPAGNSLTFLATDTALLVNENTPILPDGIYVADLTSNAAVNGFQALNPGGGFLDGLGNGTPGSGDYTATFTISATAAGEDVLWSPATADGPGQALAAPGMNQAGGGYPFYLDDRTGQATQVQLTLDYNPALLTVTGVSGAGFALLPSSTPGQAVLQYSGPALPSGMQTPIGYLLATVPSGSASSPTPYKAKDLLHFAGLSLNGGTIPVMGVDALHLVAYVGDANGDGAYSSDDAMKITHVSLQMDSGFTAYPLVDPLVVADTDGFGFLPAVAAMQVNEASVGYPTANLPSPPIPGGVVFQTIGNNVDPMLSVHVRDNGTDVVTAEVNLDDPHPAGSTGLIQGHLALRYNPNAFTVSAADIRLGSLLAAGDDWTLSATIDAATGQIGIAIMGTTPISSSLGGNLVTIDLHPLGEPGALATGVRETPPVAYARGSLGIGLVAFVTLPNRQVIFTELEDAQGAFTLSPGGNFVMK